MDPQNKDPQDSWYGSKLFDTVGMSHNLKRLDLGGGGGGKGESSGNKNMQNDLADQETIFLKLFPYKSMLIMWTPVNVKQVNPSTGQVFVPWA